MKIVDSFPAYDIVLPKKDSLTDYPIFKDNDTVAVKFNGRYKIFTFGSVVSFALENGDDPIESYKESVERGHNTHWLNANCVSIVAGHREKETHYYLEIGDEVLFEGFIFRIEKDWNDNLKLVKIDSKKEIFKRRLNEVDNEAS